MKDPETVTQELKPVRLLAYGLPGLPLAALGLPLYIYLPTYYARDMALGAGVVGTVLLLARLFDVITDPLVGMMNDRWQWRGWRRRLAMVAGTPFLLLGTWLLFQPPSDVGPGWLLMGTLLAYWGWTLISIPHAAWGAELSPDYHERSRLAASREGFQALGVLVALTLPLLAGTAQNIEATLRLLLYGIALALPLSVGAAVFSLPESGLPGRQSISRSRCRSLLRNRPLRLLLLTYILDGLANGLPATLFLLFVGERLQAPEAVAPLLALYFLMGIVALPAWVRLSRRIGKHRAWAFSMGLGALSMVIVPWLGPKDLTIFAVTVAITGSTLGADMTLPTAMQADVVDIDRLLSGGERAGLLFGLWGLVTKLALALAVGIAFPLLELAGYEPGLRTQPDSALWTLSWLYAGLPVLLKLPCIWVAWHFPLDERMQAKLRRSIGRQYRKAKSTTDGTDNG